MPRGILQVERMVTQTMDCELFMLRIFASIFRRECGRSQSMAARHVIVDSGANEGTWSVLAGSHGGCSVLAIEPQPSCARLINSSLLKNAKQLGGRVTLLQPGRANAPSG